MVFIYLLYYNLAILMVNLISNNWTLAHPLSSRVNVTTQLNIKDMQSDERRIERVYVCERLNQGAITAAK